MVIVQPNPFVNVHVLSNFSFKVTKRPIIHSDLLTMIITSYLSNCMESLISLFLTLFDDCSYDQACIVERAYDLIIDWSTALYHHCVFLGSTAYLNAWSQHHQLTSTVVQDVARR